MENYAALGRIAAVCAVQHLIGKHKMQYSLAGKVAIVTGGGSGIGRQISVELSALGAEVIVADINADSARETTALAGPKAAAITLDVTDADGWAAIFAETAQRYGKLDILVNNAGIMMSCPFAAAPLAILQRQHAVNVEGVYMGMQGALPLLHAAIERGAVSASIINISSVYGKVAGAQFAAYSATKGAVRALSRAVAFELAKTGIRVNTVLPGPVATNLSAQWDPPTDQHGRPISAEQALAMWSSLIPMGRLGNPGDIAPVVAFLASDAAQFVTGAEFVVDGGYTSP
jgi:NAD(P)-dependent dehydrogenase (short-subunit alcohol dehydrogenase family)